MAPRDGEDGVAAAGQECQYGDPWRQSGTAPQIAGSVAEASCPPKEDVGTDATGMRTVPRRCVARKRSALVSPDRSLA